jgi:hypothetical protein
VGPCPLYLESCGVKGHSPPPVAVRRLLLIMFKRNMVNGIHALCQYPFPDDYNGPVFPMYLVEHQPMDLTGQLDTDEKLNKWEQDIYEQYSEITPDNCPPVRMARAICHQHKTKTVFIGDSVKIAGIATKKNQTEEAAAQDPAKDLCMKSTVCRQSIESWLGKRGVSETALFPRAVFLGKRGVSETALFSRVDFFVSVEKVLKNCPCWLDTELANTDKEGSVVVAKGGAIIVINFNSKLVQSKE